MAGLNDLVGGFQQGALFRERMTQFGEERQSRRRKNEGERRALEVETGEALTPEVTALYDPYDWSLKNMFQGLFSRRRERKAQEQAATAPVPATTAPATSSALPVAPAPAAQPGMAPGTRTWGYGENPTQPLQFQSFQDGGTVFDEREAARRAATERFEASQRPRPPGVGQRIASGARRVANLPGRAGGALGLGAAVVPQMGEDYDRRMEERFGWEEPQADEGDPSLAGYGRFLGRRALGYASDLGNMLTFGKAGGLYRDTPEQPATARPDVAAAVEASAPAEVSAEPARSPAGGGAATPQSESSFVGDPAPEQEAAMLGSVDVMPDDMPTMGTRDWIAYRHEMVPALMMQGMSAQEAHEQVSTMQHQGFMRYGQQAAMMLQANNPQGAARALKAAYQYFPNGSDVRFGMQGDNLVAIGLNEETGEVVGKPQVITPEYLASMMSNFQDPARYLAWTKDWRDESFREREYQEVTRPMTQARIQQGNRALEIDETNAMARLMEAEGELGGGGQTDASIRAAESAFRESLGMLGLDDEAAAEQLASVMAQIRIRIPPQQLPDSQIIEDIMAAYRNGNLPQVLESLGIQ